MTPEEEKHHQEHHEEETRLLAQINSNLDLMQRDEEWKAEARALLERWYEWQMGRGPAGGSIALLQDTRAFLAREQEQP